VASTRSHVLLLINGDIWCAFTKCFSVIYALKSCLFTISVFESAAEYYVANSPTLHTGCKCWLVGSEARTARIAYKDSCCRALQVFVVVFSNQMQYKIWFVWFRVLNRAQNSTVVELERCRSNLNGSGDQDT